MKKILFFTPFAARNGAEMMILYVIKSLREYGYELAIYCPNASGDLLSEFAEYAEVYTPVVEKKSLFNILWRKVRGKVDVRSSFEKQILNIQESFKPDFWYINTILCPEAVSIANRYNISYVIHFHELTSLYQIISAEDLKLAVDGAKMLLGCSKKVCANLSVLGGKNVKLQYECVDFSRVQIDKELQASILKTYKTEGVFVWVMSGSIEYRKGADLIIYIAKHFGDKIKILWLGPGSSGYSYFLQKQLDFEGVKNIHFLGGRKSDYYEYLSIADGLMLTSREDPFPLVMIEAGFLGKPIVAFNSGGSKEFVSDSTGIIAEDFNVSSFINAMESVMNDEIGFNKQAAINRAKEYDTEIQVSKLSQLLINL